MRLEIGKVYRFNYQRTTEKKWKDSDRILCTLTDKEKEKLISNTQEWAERIKENSYERFIQAQPLKILIGDLNKLEKNRKSGERKSDIYLKLEKDIEDIKKQLFPKRKYTVEQKARRSFVRYFAMDNIRFEKTGFMQAMYAGSTMTRNGHKIEKWVVFSPIKIPKEKFHSKYMIKVELKKWDK